MTLPQMPQDKANHLVYGLVIFAIAALVLSPLYALCLTVAAGAAKEALDATGRGQVELLDFVATSAGGGIGFYCTFL